MNTCSQDHDEIHFHVDVCPLCQALEDLSFLEDENSSAQDEIDSLRSQIIDLEEEITSFEEAAGEQSV